LALYLNFSHGNPHAIVCWQFAGRTRVTAFSPTFANTKPKEESVMPQHFLAPAGGGFARTPRRRNTEPNAALDVEIETDCPHWLEQQPPFDGLEVPHWFDGTVENPKP
jgi:hypothetical protein